MSENKIKIFLEKKKIVRDIISNIINKELNKLANFEDYLMYIKNIIERMMIIIYEEY